MMGAGLQIYTAAAATLTIQVTQSPNQTHIITPATGNTACLMSETGVEQGTVIRIINPSSAADLTFADTAGTQELAGAFTASQWDAISLVYTVDRWVELSRSNN